MPNPIQEVLVPKDDPLLSDAVVERMWEELHAEYKISHDHDIQFLTWVEPSRVVEMNGVYRARGKLAAFAVVSPDPNGKDRPLMTQGSTPLKEYRQADKDAGHFVSGKSHPARTIFGHLIRAHAKAIGALTGLTPLDEEQYEKNLKIARVLVEQAQGDRYVEGETMQ